MAYRHYRDGILMTANVLTFLLFLGVNICTVIFPQLVYGDIKQTYITPTIWAFLVWPVIHILLLSTVIYQFASSRGKTVIVDGVSWEFPLINILYAILITSRVSHHYTAAFAAAVFIVYIIGNISWTLKRDYLPLSEADHLFVHLAFSALQAWTAFIGYLVAFEAFGVDATEEPNGIWTNVFVFLALFILQFGGAAFALSPVGGDRPAAFIMSWTLWAIADKQRSSGFIHGSAVAFFVMSLIWSFAAADGIYRKCTGRPNYFDDERGPLLGR